MVFRPLRVGCAAFSGGEEYAASQKPSVTLVRCALQPTVKLEGKAICRGTGLFSEQT